MDLIIPLKRAHNYDKNMYTFVSTSINYFIDIIHIAMNRKISDRTETLLKNFKKIV